MTTTLAELQQECERIGRRVTDANLPLKMFGKDCEVLLKLCGDNGNYWVEVRPSIGLNEQAAIIMQMFEDGNSDSIAALVADHIEKAVIDKACEWLESNAYLYVDDIDQLHESALIADFRLSMEE